MDASGRQLNITYGANKKVSTVTNPAERTFKYGYDTNQNLDNAISIRWGTLLGIAISFGASTDRHHKKHPRECRHNSNL